MSEKELTPAEKTLIDALEGHITDNSDDPHGNIKIMLYGDSGNGKTTLAMQLAQEITPEGKTICYMDSAQGWWFIPPNLRENGFRMAVNGIAPIRQVVRACSAKLGRFENVGTIIVDEHSSLANLDLLDVTKKNAEKSDKEKDPYAPEWKDMNASSNRLLMVSTELAMLDGINVILISHERTDKEDSTGIVRHAPLHLPKYSSRLSGMLHLVGRVTADVKDVDDGKVEYGYSVQIHPTKRVEAKCKIGGMNKVKVPSEELIKVVKNWLSVKVEPEIKMTSLEEELEEVGN